MSRKKEATAKQTKQQILLAQPKGIQGLKRQKPIPCRPVLFHRKLKGRNQ